MSNRVATVRGVFLKPGVSKNNRLYTSEAIGKAVDRMSTRIASNGTLPLTMFPSHGAADADNALMTIGRVTRVAQREDGSATFEADIANTSAGRDLAALVTPKQPYVRGISIRGSWATPPITTETSDGKKVTTADDIEIHGIDWTGRPGVEGAEITSAELAESANPELAICEAADVEFFFDETAPEQEATIPVSALRNIAEAFSTAIEEVAADVNEAGNAPGDGSKPYGDVTYADPGYQKDKKKRYPINTAAHVRAAWAYISKSKNAGAYSSRELARIKGKIKSAAKKFGIDIANESEMLESDFKDVIECYVSMCIDNGQGSATVSGSIGPDDQDKINVLAQRIATAAMAAVNSFDPDNDGDIDLDGAEAASVVVPTAAPTPDDDDLGPGPANCIGCSHPLPDSAMYCPTCGQVVPQAESTDSTVNAAESASTTESEAIVPESTETPGVEAIETSTETPSTVATPAPPVAPIQLTPDQFNALLSRIPAEAAPAAPAATTETATPAEPAAATEESAAPQTFTLEQVQEIAAKAAADAAKAAMETAAEAVRTGTTERVGLSSGAAAEAVAAPRTLEELAKMSDEEFRGSSYESWRNADPMWADLFDRADVAYARRMGVHVGR